MDLPGTGSPALFPILLVVFIPILFAIIHINVAVYLYKYAKEYKAQYGVPLFFMHPIVLGLTGLAFGLLASLITSLVLAIERRKQLSLAYE